MNIPNLKAIKDWCIGKFQAKGSYLTKETDPTVPAWAKASTKPAYTKSEVGLGNVDNTSDLNKPISTATQNALNGKAAGLHTHNYAGSSTPGGAAETALDCTGNAATATKWKAARNINGMSVQGDANRVNYGTCATAAATAVKTVVCTGFALVTGAEITVKFTVTNTASSPTLNVNGTGAKAIYYRGSAIDAGYLAINRTYTFRYNGTQYELVGDINIDTNTTYSNMTGATAGAAGKTGLVPAPAAGKQNQFLRGDGTWQDAGATTPTNNLLATVAGNPLDAVQGKVLNEKIGELNDSLGTLSFGYTADGKPGYKEAGADTVFPFSSGNLKLLDVHSSTYGQALNDRYITTIDKTVILIVTGGANGGEANVRITGNNIEINTIISNKRILAGQGHGTTTNLYIVSAPIGTELVIASNLLYTIMHGVFFLSM